MDATEMFLIRHERLHAHVQGVTDGLTEQQVRIAVQPGANPLAWLLWHIARAEDSAINLLICDTPEVLNEEWLARLNVHRRDVGTGMTTAEVAELSATVNVATLMAYLTDVGARTRERVASLQPADLDETVSDDRLHRMVEQTVQGPAGPRLAALWNGTPKGHFLVWLPLTHNYEHVGQADLIRGLLGRPGRL